MSLSLSQFTARQHAPLLRALLILLICAFVNLSARIAWAAPSAQGVNLGVSAGMVANAGKAVTWKVCKTNVCFKTQEAKDKWAQDNQCQFLEDVCSKSTPAQDSGGAQAEDEGFWGSLWDDIKGAVVYGYEFVKGLYAGMKEQVMDLVSLVTEFDDVVTGLVQLGKAFFEDPQGTLLQLAELLGQEAVDTITKATQCGAYDLGLVIGTYVSPAFALKLASKMAKYSGKLADATKALKHDYGCASFGADTLVMTPQGFARIEDIAEGVEVLSRNEVNYADRAQPVARTFGRMAPSYRVLTTELGSFRVTDEHPLWVQGKGWTVASEISADDVLAGAHGDVVVTGNDAVAKPLRVYNFSVSHSPSYFVGKQGIWAHNASCNLELLSKKFDDLTTNEKGYRAERNVYDKLSGLKYEPVGKSFDPTGKPPETHFAEWKGKRGIDGIYKRDGKYVIVESKAKGGGVIDPEDCVDQLCLMKDGRTRQMSEKWITDRLDAMGVTPEEKAEILEGLRNPASNKVTRVYAQTDGENTAYNVINETFEDVLDENGVVTDQISKVKIGKKWDPVNNEIIDD